MGLLGKLTKNREQDINKSDSNVMATINEAVAIINDMLEVGLGASIFSEIDYEGFIIAVPSARPPFKGRNTNYGFHIRMVSVDNLKLCANRYPAMRKNPANFEMIQKLDSFAEKYDQYYSENEKAYICETRNVAPVRTGSGEQDRLCVWLFEEVEKKCPLADFRGTPIHTKNVAH